MKFGILKLPAIQRTCTHPNLYQETSSLVSHISDRVHIRQILPDSCEVIANILHNVCHYILYRKFQHESDQ